MSSLGTRMNDEELEEVDDKKEVGWDDDPLDTDDVDDVDTDDVDDLDADDVDDD